MNIITWHSDPADEGWDWDSPEERLNDPLVKIIDDDVVCPCCEKKNKNYDSERIKCWSCDELFNNPNYKNE